MAHQIKHIRTSKKGRRFVAGSRRNTYRCWSPFCRLYKENRWMTKDELIKRKDGNHIDYVCPECERAIICNRRRISGGKMLLSGKTLVDVKVGDVFYRSWGYDQTQNDFIQVVEISPTGKSVICRMVGKKRSDEKEGWSVVPTEMYGNKFRMLIKNYEDRVYLVGSYAPIEGDSWKMQGNFYKWSGEPMYETPPGFGH